MAPEEAPSSNAPGSKRRPGKTLLSADDELPAVPLVDHAYRAIREAIREGRFKSGQRLVEREIAAWLGMSRTPVREALKLLEAQGLASTVVGRGLVITSLSLEEISELYTVWEDFEGIAARRAAQRVTDLEIETLEKLCACWDSGGEVRALGRLNKKFHAAIHQAAHNRFLVRSLRAIDDSIALLGLATYSIPGRTAEVGVEHFKIVDGIARRDPDAAEESARAHIRRAGELRMMVMADLALGDRPLQQRKVSSTSATKEADRTRRR